jgi:hypothetical protein
VLSGNQIIVNYYAAQGRKNAAVWLDGWSGILVADWFEGCGAHVQGRLCHVILSNISGQKQKYDLV